MLLRRLYKSSNIIFNTNSLLFFQVIAIHFDMYIFYKFKLTGSRCKGVLVPGFAEFTRYSSSLVHCLCLAHPRVTKGVL